MVNAPGATAGVPDTFEWSGGDAPPHPGKPLGHFLLDSLRRFSTTVSVPAQIDVQCGTSKSYSEVLVDSVRAARAWRGLGLGVGDTLAVFSGNNHLEHVAVFGALMEGLTIGGVLPSANKDEARHFFRQLSPRVVLCEPSNLSVAQAVVPEGIPLVLASSEAPVDGILSIGEMLAKQAEAGDEESYKAADVGDAEKHVACVFFSSGTSGLSKAVMWSNHSVTLSASMSRFPPGTRMLVTSSVSWLSGFMSTVVPLICGVTLVLYHYTDEKDLLLTVQKYKITTTFLAPTRFILLAGLVSSLRREGRPDAEVSLSPMAVALSGGAPMSAHVQKTCSELLGIHIVQGYGATEHGIITFPAQPTRFGAVGKLAPGVRARLVDKDTGKDIAEANTVGELRLKPPCFMMGYKDQPETTAQAMDSLGFYRTGDLASFDEDGYLHISNRIKDVLKFLSYTLAPAEIEDVVLTHPSVRDACVVGRPHPVAGDVPTAFVTLLPGRQASEQEIQDLVAGRLSRHKQLGGGVFFVEAIPTTSNGKHDRKALQRMLQESEDKTAYSLPEALPDCLLELGLEK